ncbi:unnamed protein product, partial [Urochloa humidicola]
PLRLLLCCAACAAARLPQPIAPVAAPPPTARRNGHRPRPRLLPPNRPRHGLFPTAARRRILPAASPQKHGTAGAAERAHKHDPEKEAQAGRREDNGVDPPPSQLPPVVDLGPPVELRLSPQHRRVPQMGAQLYTSPGVAALLIQAKNGIGYLLQYTAYGPGQVN